METPAENLSVGIPYQTVQNGRYEVASLGGVCLRTCTCCSTFATAIASSSMSIEMIPSPADQILHIVPVAPHSRTLPVLTGEGPAWRLRMARKVPAHPSLERGSLAQCS